MASLTRARGRNLKDAIGFAILGGLLVIVLLAIIGVFADIVGKGSPALTWRFLVESPRAGMTAGGILPAIVGTVLVTLICTIVAAPVGVMAAIYLAEYSRDTWFVRIVRSAVRNLAGVPSVVYGLFGLGLFVSLFHLGVSVLASGLTLALMTLPWVITAAEEALRSIPVGFREGSFALGATKWQTIRSVVLPYALPGILTGVILGVSRAAGETAPILFTGVAFYLPHLPESLRSQFMALPYHLFALATQHHDIAGVRPLAYGTALVLIGFVFALNLAAFLIRYRARKAARW